MIDQPGRLPLAQYLRVLDLARHLDPNMVEDISIESVEEAIKRQLGSILPAFHARVGFKSYEDLKQEEEAISRILNIIEAEIRPLASEFTPGFVDHLQQEYQEQWNTVQNKLNLSDEFDKAYWQIREEEKEALRKRKEKLLEAHQLGLGLKSVPNLTEEIKRLEEVEGELKHLLKKSAEEWAELAEQQTDQAKAKELWEKALERDNDLEMSARQEKHIAALGALEERTSRAWQESASEAQRRLKEAQALYDRAARSPLQTLSSRENDLRQALEMCQSIIDAFADHPYPSPVRQEAMRLKERISNYNDLVRHWQTTEYIAQAELGLNGNHLAQANQNMARARESLALISNSELGRSLAERLKVLQQEIDARARQQTCRVIERWCQQAQIYLDDRDAVAALNCIYSAQSLYTGSPPKEASQGEGAPEAETMRKLALLENSALDMLCQEIDSGGRALAERAQEIFSREDAQSAFRWLEAALKLDAKAVLSDSGFRELLDAYFDFQSKQQRFESLLFQAEACLARDPSSPDSMAAAEDLLSEAQVVGGHLGATVYLEEIEEKRTSLRQLHRKALVEQLNGLLQKLEDMWRSQPASSQQMTEALSALKDLAHILAKVEKAELAVQSVKPHLQRAFEYYSRLRSEKELEGDKHSIEGYSLSYMLLSKVSGWETG